MNDQHPDNNSENSDNEDSQEPVHAEFQHRAVTARLPEDVRGGVFANTAIVMSGHFEFVLDFILRLGKPDLVTARVILPVPVTHQFSLALKESVENYERQFGEIPALPHPAARNFDQTLNPKQTPGGADPVAQKDLGGFVGAITPQGTLSQESMGETPQSQNETPLSIDEIYEDLKLEDELLGGVYANAVLLRNSSTEFCFDFVTNIYPRSCVNARVFMAVPQVKPLLSTLTHSLTQYRNQQNPPPE